MKPDIKPCNVALSALLFSSAFLCNSLLAETLNLKPGEQAVVEVSAREPNRIAVEGRRITQYFHADGYFGVDADEQNGQVFVRLIDAFREGSAPGGAYIRQVARDSRSLFIVTEDGHTFTLNMVAKDKPAESILIRPQVPRSRTIQGQEVASSMKSADHEQRVVALMTAMYRHQTEMFDVVNVGKDISLWPGLSARHEWQFQVDGWLGEVIDVKNESSAVVRTDEPLFANRFGALAVAVDRHLIGPSGRVRVFLSREDRSGCVCQGSPVRKRQWFRILRRC